jgi:two-component system, cell cycle sensor histidine kinase and response regulator CckA
MLDVQREQPPPREPETILLVEDEEMLMELVRSLLELNGYRLLTASDGKQAVELFQKHHQEIDLVLTDLGLPKIGGWEACKQMQQLNPNLPIIVATGYLDPTEKREMLNGGVKAFVTKPYLSGELLESIHLLLAAKDHAEE